jgi:hypothetical protein
MSAGIVPICFTCLHYRKVVESIGYTCDAFPNKSIPVEILASELLHSVEHHPDDNGIMFEPKYPDEENDLDERKILEDYYPEINLENFGSPAPNATQGSVEEPLPWDEQSILDNYYSD